MLRLNVFTIGKRWVRGRAYVKPDPLGSVLGGVYLYNGTSNEIRSYGTLTLGLILQMVCCN